MKTQEIKPHAKVLSHSWHVFQIYFSPDGSLLAVASQKDVGAVLIETKNWSITRKFSEANHPASSLEFSPDGRSLAVALCQDLPVYCWDVATGRVMWSLPKAGMHVAFSPDGKILATTKGKAVLLVEALTGKIRHQLEGHKSRVDITAFSSDGRRVASVGQSQAMLWDAQKGKLIRVVQDKSGGVTQLRFSPNGKLLATTGKEGKVRLYDAELGELVHDLAGHAGRAWDLAFTKNGKFLVSVGWDDFVKVWNIVSGQLLRSIALPEESQPGHLALSPDGRTVAVPLGYPIQQIQLLDIESGELLKIMTMDEKAVGPERLDFSPNGQWLASACSDGHTRIWKTK
jgi:WD40 repeat protein